MDQYKEIWNTSVLIQMPFGCNKQSVGGLKTPPTIGQEGDFHSVEQAPFSWFSDGVLNVTTSCLDRHIETRGDKTAILWEGDSPEDTLTLNYRELLAEVCRLANVLKDKGVQKGDRVIIYMGHDSRGRDCDVVACARIGAVHSVVLVDLVPTLCETVLKIASQSHLTQDSAYRGGRKIALKDTVDEACTERVETVLVYGHTGDEIAWHPQRDCNWNERLNMLTGL